MLSHELRRLRPPKSPKFLVSAMGSGYSIPFNFLELASPRHLCGITPPLVWVPASSTTGLLPCLHYLNNLGNYSLAPPLYPFPRKN